MPMRAQVQRRQGSLASVIHTTSPMPRSRGAEEAATGEHSGAGIDEMREVFENFDVNGDGEIDVSELSTVLGSLGFSPSPQQLTDLMKQADEDEDGRLSFDEFVRMIRSSDVKTDYEIEKEELRAVFNKIDVNRNGQVDRDELSRIMRAFGQKLSQDEIDVMVEQADTNGDGVISFEEFVTFVYNDGVYGDS